MAKTHKRYKSSARKTVLYLHEIYKDSRYIIITANDAFSLAAQCVRSTKLEINDHLRCKSLKVTLYEIMRKKSTSCFSLSSLESWLFVSELCKSVGGSPFADR